MAVSTRPLTAPDRLPRESAVEQAPPAPALGPASRRRERWLGLASRLTPTAVLLGTLLLAWEAAVRLSGTPAYLMPAPSAVAARWLADPGLFVGEGLVSLFEALAGLVLGCALALLAGLLMARWRWLERALLPVAVLVKVTPVVVLAPLFVLWFGFGSFPRICIASLLTFFPVLVGAVSGLRSADPAARDVFFLLDASPRDDLLRLRLPYALPHLFAALKVSSTLALLGAVIAEWVAGDRGLGRVILLANTHLDVATAIAGVATLAVIGISMIGAISLLERRLLFWHPGQTSL